MADNGRETQAPQPETELLIKQLTFRCSESDKDDARFLGFWNEKTESEVLRRFFDFEGLRAEAAKCRADRDARRIAAAS